MRIALFTETFLPRVDGITNTLCHLLRYLEARGHTALLFAPAGAGSRFGAIPIHELSGWRFPPYPEFQLIPPWAAVEMPLRRFAPDLVHTLNPVTLGLRAIRVARALDLPVVASYHTDVPGFMARWGVGWLSPLVQAYMRWMHNQADLNLCPSTFTLRQLQRMGYQRLDIWTRAVDTRLFHPAKRSAEWRARLSAGDTTRTLLLFVGRLSFEKRVDWIRLALERLPQARLAIVGDGPARAAWQQHFAGLPVVFTGALRGEALACAYASADIFVFPAANETMGNVVLEAMASGLPVVAPTVGGFTDYAAHEETALLFPPEDREALVAHIARLVQHPALAQRLGAAGRARMERQSWDAVFDTLMEQYQRATQLHTYHLAARRVWRPPQLRSPG